MGTPVAIVVLNYRNGKDTLGCLDSLAKLRGVKGRMIVVDNGSGDGSVEQIEKWVQNRFLVRYDKATALSGGMANEEERLGRSALGEALVLIEAGENFGYAGGNNIGIRYALRLGFPMVWVLNNDVIVKPDSLEIMLKMINSDPKFGLVGASIHFLENKDEVQAAGGGYVNPWLGVSRHFVEEFNEPPKKFPYVSGACFLARREMLEDVGLLDEDFFLYWEDTDLSVRAIDQGWKLGCAKDAIVYHGVGKTAGIGSPVTEFHHARSGVLFFWKHQRKFSRWLLAVFILLKIGHRIFILSPMLKVCLSGIKRGIMFVLRTPSSKAVL